MDGTTTKTKANLKRRPANDVRAPLTKAEADALAVAHLSWAEKIARRMCRRWSFVEADDAVAEVAVELVRMARVFDPARGNFRNWILPRVRGAVVDYRRRLDYVGRHQLIMDRKGIETKVARRGRPLRLHTDVADFDEETPWISKLFAKEGRQLELAALAEILNKIDQMPERVAYAMRRHFFDDVSLLEVGRELGVTESRACQFVHEGRKLLEQHAAAGLLKAS